MKHKYHFKKNSEQHNIRYTIHSVRDRKVVYMPWTKQNLLRYKNIVELIVCVHNFVFLFS